MTSSILQKLYLILAVTAVVPLTVAVIGAMNTFEDWTVSESRLALEEQRTIFHTLVQARQAHLGNTLSRFGERREVAKALKLGDRSSLLTLAISAIEPTGWKVFHIVSADGKFLIDPFGMRRGAVDPKYEPYLSLALSNQPATGLEFDPANGVGIVGSLPIHDEGGRLIGAMAVFDPFAKDWLDGLKAMTKHDLALITTGRQTVSSTWLPAGAIAPALLGTADASRPARLVAGDHEYFAMQDPLNDLDGNLIGQVLITRSSIGFRAVLNKFKVHFGALALGALALALALGFCCHGH